MNLRSVFPSLSLTHTNIYILTLYTLHFNALDTPLNNCGGVVAVWKI